MFRNYLAAALRNLVRNRVYSAINIVGLSVGFTAALLIALFVRDELSYDHFFPDYQHIYLLGDDTSLPGRATQSSDATPAELAPALKADFPSIGAIARLAHDDMLVRQGTIENHERVTWADPTLLDIFKFTLVAGTLENALADSNSVVITRSEARKYFGRDDPIGLTLQFRMIAMTAGATVKTDIFKVAAVIEDLPSNTNLDINIIASARNPNSVLAQVDAKPPVADRWRQDFLTYLKLANAAAVDQVQNGLAEFMQHHKAGIANSGDHLYAKLILRPIATQHLTPGIPGMVLKPRGNIDAIYAVAAIGLLIVFAAAINFVNLMTARAMRRATEVGVRKATGAARRHVIIQFIGEAVLYVLVSMGCGFMLATVFLPRLNAFLDRNIALGALADIRAIGFIAAAVVLVGILAGAYPAFVLASLRPAAVLRGIVGRQTSSRLRRSLAVLQFAVLIGLLVPTAVVYRQTQYALTEAQRLDTDQVLFIRDPCTDAFKEGLKTIPGVRGVACSAPFSMQSGGGAPIRTGPAKDANGAYITVAQGVVSDEFFGFFGLKPIAGRFFSEDHPADAMPADPNASLQGAVVLNEAAVGLLGFASPQDAIGRSTSLNEKTGALSEIIGVVPDFAFDAVHSAVPATVYTTSRNVVLFPWARIDGARVPETLAAIDGLWKRVGTPLPSLRDFLDQRIADLYADITRRGTLFEVSAAVAVAIAALGLLGLALFTAEQRTKEIGIRKSMGATRRDILALLLWEFAKPVLLANLIAWPVAYYFMRRWLQGFAHHIDLAPWMFLAASGLALAIALVTVIGHTLLGARAKPVTALRYE